MAGAIGDRRSAAQAFDGSCAAKPVRTTIDAHVIGEALQALIPRLASDLPADVRAALCRMGAAEENPAARAAAELLQENAAIACERRTPLCQDTGTVRVWLEIGPDIAVAGDVFSQVDRAVAASYTMHRLRASVVRDALSARTNTKDNTPAFCRIVPSEVPGRALLHVMLKGGGSDNASKVVMLPPAAGTAGIVEAVAALVREKGANACPPLTIGVGVGGTFDTVAELAFRALMRPVGEPAHDEAAAALEREVLRAVNATGVGIAGLGGNNSAFSVAVETAPCHIAALPVAIEMGCCALRRATIDLSALLGKAYAPQAREEALLRAIEESGLYAGGAFENAAFAGCADERPDADAGAKPDAKPDADAGVCLQACASNDVQRYTTLTLPLSREALSALNTGQTCLLTGEMYIARDAAHLRLLAELQETGTLPYCLAGQTILYAGPTPPPADNSLPFGAVGPTTASRMDFAAPALYEAGVVATIGKGTRSAAVADACNKTGSVYFTCVGGAAAKLADCIERAEIVAYEDLGTEALRRISVRDFPVTVALSCCAAHVGEHIGCESAAESACESAPAFADEPVSELASAPASAGVFITFEGGDGCGKTTHIARLAQSLRSLGREVLCLREPGGTAIGEALRNVVLDADNVAMSARTELLIYEAARAQIVDEVIAPALRRGAVVLCDRFYDSTFAYQGYGRGLDKDFIARVNRFACGEVRPDRTLLLVCGTSVADSLERATKDTGADRIENAGLPFHERVNRGFLEVARGDAQRIRIVNTDGTKDETAWAITRELADLFPELLD